MNHAVSVYMADDIRNTTWPCGRCKYKPSAHQAATGCNQNSNTTWPCGRCKYKPSAHQAATKIVILHGPAVAVNINPKEHVTIKERIVVPDVLLQKHVAAEQ